MYGGIGLSSCEGPFLKQRKIVKKNVFRDKKSQVGPRNLQLLAKNLGHWSVVPPDGNSGGYNRKKLQPVKLLVTTVTESAISRSAAHRVSRCAADLEIAEWL